MSEQKNYTGGFVDGKYFVRMQRYNSNLSRNVAYTYHPPGLHSYHTHDFYEMNYIIKGECVNYVSGENIKMKAGDAILMHPGTFHSLYSEEDSLAANFLIRRDFLISALSSANQNLPFGKFIEASKKDDYYRYILFKGGAGDISLAEKLITLITDNSQNAEVF